MICLKTRLMMVNYKKKHSGYPAQFLYIRIRGKQWGLAKVRVSIMEKFSNSEKLNGDLIWESNITSPPCMQKHMSACINTHNTHILNFSVGTSVALKLVLISLFLVSVMTVSTLNFLLLIPVLQCFYFTWG